MDVVGVMFKKVVIGECELFLVDCMGILPFIDDESINMIWTDPPYGHSNHDGDLNSKLNDFRGIHQQPIANDDHDSMRTVVDGMLAHASRVLKKDSCCCCCCCGGGGPRPTFAWLADRMDKQGLSFFHSVIWDKKNPGLGWRYRRRHEMLMISHRSGGRISWSQGDRAVPNIIECFPPRNRMHPNEKPIDLVGRFIEWHSTPGDVVLDPFMGSGTTGVACARLGRKFIGIELEKKFFDIACSRIDDSTKQRELLCAGHNGAYVHEKFI